MFLKSMNFLFKKKSYKTFNLIVIGSFFIVSIIFTGLLNIFFPIVFQNKIEIQNYHNSLYGNSETGCSTLEYIDPEVLFIGDSSGYHSWDFDLFAKKTQKKVGTCFLQGFSILSIEHLLNFLQKKNLKPEFLILSNSYRIFLNKKINEGFASDHKKYLSDIIDSKFQKRFQILSKYLRGKKLLKVTIPLNQDINVYLDNIEINKVNLLVENIILKNKETSGFKNYESLKKKFYDQNFYFETHENYLNLLCNYISKNKINLVLTKVPTSIQVKNLVNKKQNENDLKVIEYLEKCTTNKLYSNTNPDDFKINNKYFILSNNNENDYLKLKEYMNEFNDKNYVTSFFDFTHMNRYGSQKFTNAWLKKNNFIFKIENK